MSGPLAPLRETQLWFSEAITCPESAGSGWIHEGEAGRRLTAGPRLSPLERLDIYRRSYHARLVECLADDYPVLKHALGDDIFEALCREYIARYPSQNPNLNGFGAGMARFCRDEAPDPLAARTFAADLATLEWSIVEVIHASSVEPVGPERLREVPAGAWPSARLTPTPALRVCRFDYPVNAYFNAVREEREPAVPGPSATATAVYRRGPTVWRMDLTEAMRLVLSALTAGEPLGASLARAETALAGVDPDEATQRVGGWFQDWISAGLFVGVEVVG